MDNNRTNGGNNVGVLKKDVPHGMNVAVGAAAKTLGVSRSTLKRRASQWGLTTFWDRRGRRFALHEIEAAKKGMLEPKKPATLTLDIEQLSLFSIPDGHRFRVYKTERLDKGYIGYYGGQNYGDVLNRLRSDHGGGVFHLKLLEPDGCMTGLNFTVSIDEPPGDELQEIENMGTLTKFIRYKTKQMRKNTEE